ncbi:tRNA/rRNA methyltransferase [Gallaecimonas xiamenensis]|uniref:tRNA (cytidine/uridine-2'-O-)-methyltransferase TrmJ n=1 Tax=Gallaecimonas xiamenensis 3-C-1 TaxID=745411 RepID=K2JX52_9GAMM|nr:tRNA/rRNA methyltransferase [Gallaecimonas xiamenensis]EKE74889.1 RNA methyltransferase [Gallaecimonas xiamenensis 3-C-1]
MEICFVLVRPARPENIGAAARAIKTMGFSQLRVVGSDAHLAPQAQWVAHGAQEVMAQIQAFDQLKDALADCDLAVGTTARARSGKHIYLTPNELKAQALAQQGAVRRLALVFGCEESGLANEELEQCQLRSYLPLAQTQPSLNLGQAVMLYAYGLQDLDHGQEQETVAEGLLVTARTRLEAVLAKAEIGPEEAPAQWAMENLNRAGERDLKLLLFILNKLL